MPEENQGGTVGGGDGGGEEFDANELHMTEEEKKLYRQGKRGGAARGIAESNKRRRRG